MKRLLLLSISIYLVACDYSTSCEGTIVSSDGNKPIEGFEVIMNTVDITVLTKSDSAGHYFLELTSEKKGGIAFGVSYGHDGKNPWQEDFQLPVFPLPEVGKSNQFDIVLFPRDAFLRVHIANKSATNGKIYGFVAGPTGVADYFDPFPLLIAQNDSLSILKRVAGGELANIFLDRHSPIDKLKSEGTVFCPRNDTTDIWVSF